MTERASTHRFSVSRRFSVALVSVVTITLFSFAAVMISIDLSRIRSDVDAQLEDKFRLAIHSIAEPLWNLDKKTIDISVDALFLDESVALVRVSDDLEVVSLRTRPEYDAY